jgi:hypothetical protein
MSTLELTDYVSDIRVLVRESTAKSQTDAAIKVYLNMALLEAWDVAAEIPQMGWVSDISANQALVAGQEEYTLPATYRSILRIEVSDGSIPATGKNWIPATPLPLLQRPPNEDSISVPVYYTLLQSSIIFTPPPLSARTIGWRVVGKVDHTEFAADASTSGLPTMCDNFLKWRSAHMFCLLEEHKETLVPLLDVEAQKAKEEMRAQLYRRHVEGMALDIEERD